MEAQHPFAVVPTAEQPLCPQEKAPCSQSICHAFNDAHLARSWNSNMAQLLQDVDMRVHQHGQELKRLIGCHLQVAKSSEDVNRHELALGVTVLASLGGGHVPDLACLAFDHDVSPLTDGSSLNTLPQGCACIGGLDCVLIFRSEEHTSELQSPI